MKPKFGREIALLTAPILLIGAVAFWNGKIKSWSGFGAPRGLYEGQPRLEITEWKPETPSALDFARGISSRWKVTTWHGGACPVLGTRYKQEGVANPTHLYFAWKRAGKWHRTRFGYGWSETDDRFFMRRSQSANYEIQLGVPLDLVPRDAEEVRLRGHLLGFISCGGTSIPAPSAPIDKLMKAPGQAWPQFAGSRASVLKFKSANQQWCLPDPVKDPKGDNLQVESVFSSFRKQILGFETTPARITDANGKWVLRISPIHWGGDANGLRGVKWIVDTRRLKKHPAPFTLRCWVYMNENQWPLEVALPLDLTRSARNPNGISTYNSKPIRPIR